MASLPLITPSDCAVVLVDYQAGLAFAAGSGDRQGIRSAALALAKTAEAFSVLVGGQHVGDQGLQRAADAAAARCPDRRSTDRTPQHEPVGGRSRQGGGRGHGDQNDGPANAKFGTGLGPDGTHIIKYNLWLTNS
jgi:hypothetical protein